MNFMPRGRTVTAAYIIVALTSFLRVLKEKRLMVTAGDWWFHWDNMPVHTAAVVTYWMTARWFQIMEHPPYLPDLALAEFFLFPSVKRELAGKTLTKETLKKEWEGAVRTLSAADFSTAFSGGMTAAKSVSTSLADPSRKAQIQNALTITIFYLLGSSGFEVNTLCINWK
jgi:hypothetical protein